MRRFDARLALLGLCLATSACKQAKALGPSEVCAQPFDTLVETGGFLVRPEPATCEERRNLGLQCSYLLVDEAPAAGTPVAPTPTGLEVTILQGAASNQLEEVLPPTSEGEAGSGIKLVPHDLANTPLPEGGRLLLKGRLFPGLRDPTSCRVEVISLRKG
jgi:hypothetical protein